MYSIGSKRKEKLRLLHLCCIYVYYIKFTFITYWRIRRREVVERAFVFSFFYFFVYLFISYFCVLFTWIIDSVFVFYHFLDLIFFFVCLFCFCNFHIIPRTKLLNKRKIYIMLLLLINIR